MEYSEHIRRNRDHEREVYARLNESERRDRWQKRQLYLRGELLRGGGFITFVLGCPRCRPSFQITLHSWPAFFECGLCSALFAIDKNSHLLPDDIERTTFITKEALRDLRALGFLKLDYPLEDRIRDLRGGSISEADNLFLKACGIEPLKVNDVRLQTKTPVAQPCHIKIGVAQGKLAI